MLISGLCFVFFVCFVVRLGEDLESRTRFDRTFI